MRGRDKQEQVIRENIVSSFNIDLLQENVFEPIPEQSYGKLEIRKELTFIEMY